MMTGTMFPIKTYKKKNFERCRCGASGDPLGPPHPLYPPLLLDVTEGNNSGGRIPA